MAVLDKNNLNLADLAKMMDPDGSIAPVVEILNLQNEILDDMNFKSGNLTTGHRTTIRTGLAEPTWRRLGGGVQPTKSRTAQITFNTALLENYSEMDAKLADLSGNAPAVRLSQDMGAIEGMNQEIARKLFFGNEKLEPETFTGLANYYSTVNDATAESADNVIDAGGTSNNNASIYLVGWSDRTLTGIVPKNSTAGLRVTDKGLVTIENVDGEGGRMEAYRTHFAAEVGLAVEDWRYGVRIANINRANLNGDASGDSADLPDLMFSAMERIHSLQGVRPVFYMDRAVREVLRKQLASKTASSTLTFEDVGGRRTAIFQEVPVRRVDALAVDEARVV